MKNNVDEVLAAYDAGFDKGYEAGADHNGKHFNEGYNKAIEEVKTLVKNRTISNVGGEIGLSITFLKDLEKLKKYV